MPLPLDLSQVDPISIRANSERDQPRHGFGASLGGRGGFNPQLGQRNVNQMRPNPSRMNPILQDGPNPRSVMGMGIRPQMNQRIPPEMGNPEAINNMENMSRPQIDPAVIQAKLAQMRQAKLSQIPNQGRDQLPNQMPMGELPNGQAPPPRQPVDQMQNQMMPRRSIRMI